MIAANRSTFDRARRRRIDRRLPRWRWPWKGESRWASFDERSYAVVIGGACLMVAGFVEFPWLAHQQTPPPQFSWFGRNPLPILPIALLNALVFDRLMTARTPRQREIAVWLRCIRFLVLGIPILGLLGIPPWRRIVTTRPNWAQRPVPATKPNILSTSLPKRFVSLRWRIDAELRGAAQRVPALAAWIIICQVLPWLTFANWLAADAPLHPSRALAILAGLHLITTACGWTFAHVEIANRQVSGLRAGWFRLSPFLFLAPVPVMLLGAAAWIPVEWTPPEESSQRESLHSVGARQSRGQWIGAAAPEPATGRHENIFRRTVYGHTILGLAVGAWIGVFFSARGWELTDPWPKWAFYFCLGGLAVAALLGWVRPLESFARRFPKFAEIIRPPFLLAASIGPVALLSGAYLGWLFERKDWSTAGSVLQSLGYSAAFLLFVAMLGLFLHDLFGTRPSIAAGVVIPLMIAGVALSGLGALIEIKIPGAILLARGLAVAALFAHLALGLSALGSLLHPFRLKHLFDRRLPGSLRARLASLAATALVPLGGLPALWWIWNRRQRGNGDARIWWERSGRQEP
ncbi:MAG TPA: hypothetical protein VN851_08420 [Thermoanaerobaculia bacterium]|nr:hypothetical protein [Thermoanaerobaculia bacterium]